MPTKTENIIKAQLKTNLPDIRPGDTVKVHQKIKEKDKERIQIFEGLVIARRHGSEPGATITVRKVTSGVGVEKVIPIHSPAIDKIEIVKRGKVRRAKLYYIRDAKGRKARLKNQDFSDAIPAEETEEETSEGVAPEETEKAAPAENQESATEAAEEEEKEKPEESNKEPEKTEEIKEEEKKEE